MRTTLLAALVATFALTSALADGDRAATGEPKAGLPKPQTGVAITMERGVRVWRPVPNITVVDDGTYYPQASSYSNSSAPVTGSDYTLGNQYGTGGYGYGFSFANNNGRFGFRKFGHHHAFDRDHHKRDFDRDHRRHDGGSDHDRHDGGKDHHHNNFGVTVITPRLPRYAMLPPAGHPGHAGKPMNVVVHVNHHGPMGHGPMGHGPMGHGPSGHGGMGGHGHGGGHSHGGHH